MKQNQTTEEKSITDYCDELSERGQLSVKWDGGNDSGWFRLCIDGEDLDDHEGRGIIDIADAVLGYGSFAGDYYTEGELFYDPETKTFKGKDNFSSNENATIDLKFQIKVPTSIWFDRMEVIVRGNSDDNYSDEAAVAFIVNNGPSTIEHELLKEKIIAKLLKHIRSLNPENGIDSIWTDWNINYSEFKKKGDYMVFTLDTLDYSYSNTENKEVEIDLNEQ